MTEGDTETGATGQATFAGGCFWCVEETFVKVPGVVAATSGYTGGHSPHPTYEEVVRGGSGHAEAVQVTFEPRRVAYEELLEIFWHNIDPTTAGRQFCDVGSQYRPVIFYHDERQRQLAIASRQAMEDSKPFPGSIVVEIVPLDVFYPAEDYHQGFYRKNPVHYQRYRQGCGRDRRLQELWSTP